MSQVEMTQLVLPNDTNILGNLLGGRLKKKRKTMKKREKDGNHDWEEGKVKRMDTIIVIS